MRIRFCKKCSRNKPVEEFTVLKRTYKEKTYVCYQSSCKECIRNSWKKWDELKKSSERCKEWTVSKSPVPWSALMEKSERKYTYTDKIATKSTIHICSCGNRYLKTRDKQTNCLPCIANFMILSTGNCYGTARTTKTILL